MSTIEHRATVRNIVPLLFVEDLERSVAFYCDSLGFVLVNEWKPDGKLAWSRLKRGTAALMLQQSTDEDGPAAGRGRGRGVEFFFLCDDAGALHAEFTTRGLDLKRPTVAFYGMNQLFLQDPDGYQLCFQSAVAQT
jgi:catechol 2,3-dioxygenase-like lactoylglutathione lyase family enzyme